MSTYFVTYNKEERMLNSMNIQLQPAVLRFLSSEKPCNDLGLASYFAEAKTVAEKVEGQRLCGGCPVLTDCQSYAQLMQDQGQSLQGVMAGTYWEAGGIRARKAERTNTKLDRTAICEGCGSKFQRLRQKPNQRFCKQACRYIRKDR